LEFLKSELRTLGVEFVAKYNRTSLAVNNAIILNIEQNISSDNKLELSKVSEEGYAIKVTKEKVTISAPDIKGQLYGILTFLQLIDMDNFSVPGVTIYDWPRMNFRGLRGHLPKDIPEELRAFQSILRAMNFCKLNQLWIRDLYTRRFPASLQLETHPEICDGDALPKTVAKDLIQYASDHNVKIMGSIAAVADIIWSIYPELIEMKPGEKPGTVVIRSEKNRTSKYRFGSRFNLCPSQEATYRLLFDLIDEIASLFTSEIIDLGVDEIGQEYNGSRWVADEFCRDKDPVVLFANYVNRLSDYVSSKNKLPLVNSEPFIKQHGGDYFKLYQSVALIRKTILVNNWSEGYVRTKKRGWFNRPSEFTTSSYFKRFGINNIIHMVNASGRWRDRPELLEQKGKIDCYGAFITHYSYMTGPDSLNDSIVNGMAFSSNHFWSPNVPEMNSNAERNSVLYAKAVIESILNGHSFTQAINVGRAAAPTCR
jgi:hypothetical protein